MPAEATPLPLGEEVPTRAKYLNHFRMDKAIAAGGMGAVYLGYDTSLQRPVALKVIRSDLARNPAFADRFLREARAQAQINHANVVQVYFVGQEGDTLFIAMELVDGGSLADRLHDKKPIGWQDVVRHMRGLAEGLSEAERLQIVHRDIKPANILLDRFGLAHLADFGLAAPVLSRDRGEPDTPVSVGSALPRLTKVGTVMGSPPYMSPEQAYGDPLDIRTDIYALGASFYEMLVGEPPTRAETINELSMFLVGPPPPKVRQRVKNVPVALADVVDRCMERDKSKRFQTYQELIAALDDAAPRPEVPGTVVQRLLAWAIDVTVFGLVTKSTFQVVPLAGFVALILWCVLGLVAVRSTPGQWMMRLVVRRPGDLPVSPMRGLIRIIGQHLWLALLAVTVATLYRSDAASTSAMLFGAMGLLFLLSVGGSLLALFDKIRRTLVDRLTGTEVLVDVR